MRARWPRGVLAGLLAASGGLVGAGALLFGAPNATAAPAAPAVPCGAAVIQTPCPPTATVTSSTTETGGTVTVTWTPSAAGDQINPGANPTITWANPNPPAGAVTPVTGAQMLGPVCTPAPGQNGALTCTYDWPPSLTTQGYILNGTYQVSAPAMECRVVIDCSNSGVVNQAVTVANAPAAPTGVKATVVPGSSPPRVQISWNPNPEPDLVGYQVFTGTSTFVCQQAVSKSHPNTYSCTATPPADGTYSFHVVAYRYGATYSNLTVNQVASANSAVSGQVSVTGVPTGVTTTVPAGAGSTLGPIGGLNPSPSKTKTTTRSSGVGNSGIHNLSPTPAQPSSNPTTEPTDGGGYNPVLPYNNLAAPPDKAPPTTTDPAVIAVPSAHKGSSVATIALIGAGLLVAVIALHGLWLRSEVRRGGALEPLEPRP